MRTKGVTSIELSLFQAIELIIHVQDILTMLRISMFGIYYPCLGYIIQVWAILSMFGIYYPDIISMCKIYYLCSGCIIHAWNILSWFGILSMFGIFYQCLGYIIHV